MPKILLAGQDIRLLETRAAVLRKTGANVICCAGYVTLKVAAAEMPDLLVLCHSLHHDEAESIADGVHTCCRKTKILLVVSQLVEEPQYRETKFDAASLAEPARLLARAKELLAGASYPAVDQSVRDRQTPVAR